MIERTFFMMIWLGALTVFFATSCTDKSGGGADGGDESSAESDREDNGDDVESNEESDDDSDQEESSDSDDNTDVDSDEDVEADEESGDDGNEESNSDGDDESDGEVEGESNDDSSGTEDLDAELDGDNSGDSDTDADDDTEADQDTDSSSEDGADTGSGTGSSTGEDQDSESALASDTVEPSSADLVSSGTDTTGTISGDAQFTVEYQRADSLNAEAPGTVFIVTWSVDLPSVDSAVIQFGTDTGYGMTAPVDLNETDYRTLLLGMKPESTYHFQVVAVSGGVEYSSEDIEVQTGPATNLFTMTNFNVLDEAAREPGFIVVISGSVAAIIDPDGDVVWWYTSTQARLYAARMSYDGKNMWMVNRLNGSGGNSNGPMERVTMDTLESQVYPGTAGSHDLIPVIGDTMAYIDYGGSGNCRDSVVEIDNSGATTEVFGAWDHLSSCHLNAVSFDEKENLYTVSDRATTVYVFDRVGAVDWLLSDIVPNTTYGRVQHGHHLLDESLLIFANDAGQNTSIAIEYSRIDGTELYAYDGGSRSSTLGDAQRLPGGNTLVTYSNQGLIHEADPDGNLVLEIQTAEQGYSNWRSSLYGPPDDLLL